MSIASLDRLDDAEYTPSLGLQGGSQIKILRTSGQATDVGSR
jgi:hypothetical protein